MVTLVMQPDGHYYHHDGDEDDVGTPDTPLSDAATAIVASTSHNGVLGHGDDLRDVHDVHLGGRLVGSLVGSLQSLGNPGAGLHHGMSSLQRHGLGVGLGHASAGKRVLFVSGHPVPRHDAMDEDADDWAAGAAHPQWSTPLVAATSRGQVPRARPDSSMDSNRTVRGESVATDWTTDSVAKSAPTPTRHNFHVGIYGWRKRCLYLLILALLVMVIVNLALTLWVLKVMEFSSEGMGQLRVVTGGLQLNGQAMVLDALIASNIRSRKGQPITIESSMNFSLNVRDEEGAMASQMFLGKDRLECAAGRFRVADAKNRTLFSANKDEVEVGAALLKVTGQGGAVFDASVQTPVVRADSGSDLRLESPTRTLWVRAPQGVVVESRAGDISASCLTDLRLHSVAGSIRLESERVFLPGVKVADVPGGKAVSSRPQGRQEGRRRDEIYQLCMCGNGKLFLSAADGVCAADDDSAVCR